MADAAAKAAVVVDGCLVAPSESDQWGQSEARRLKADATAAGIYSDFSSRGHALAQNGSDDGDIGGPCLVCGDSYDSGDGNVVEAMA